MTPYNRFDVGVIGGDKRANDATTISESNRKALATSGARFDEGKTRVDLIPAEVLLALGEIFAYGAVKYDLSNWRKGMKWSKVYAPLLRHLYRAWANVNNGLDEESGKPHIYHALWNCVALAFYMTGSSFTQFDDRLDGRDFVNMDEETRQAHFV
jgi:hypothetical protein